jgi:nuclear pore complex protein Nup98-Nup96
MNITGKPGGLFGNATGSTSFGANTGSPAPFSFGNKPAATAPAPGGSLFGGFNSGAQPQQQQSQPFGGLGQSGGLFGNSTLGQTQNNSMLGQPGGLFGSQNTMQQQQQPPSNDANPYGSNPLFNAPAGMPTKAPFYTPAEPQAKIKPALNSLPVRSTPKTMGKITRLRFAPQSNTTTPNFNRMSNSPSSLMLNNGRNSPTLTMGLGDTVLSPNAFVTRQSVKRLDLSNRASSSDLRSRSASMEPSAVGSTAEKTRVQWNPELEAATPKRTSTPASSSKLASAPREATRSPTVPLQADGEASEYVCKPSLEELEQYGAEELARVDGFSVERPGYGKIEFVEAV